MRHYFSLFCFALISFFYMDEAAAILLLKQNPTPLEPASYSISGEGYQLAKVTWLPDYLGDNKSHGGGRVDSGGKGVINRTCEEQGYLSSCSAPKTGKKISVAGLSCYEKCECDTSYYKYNSFNCLSPKVLGGEFCGDLTFYMVPSASGTKKSADLSSTPTFQKSGGKTGNYTSCTCPAEYNLPSCPENAVCAVLTCDGKYAFKGCREGYTAYGYACIKNENCSAYPLTVCPTGGTCSKCPDNNAKLKLDSCDASKGWSLSGNSCVATAPCPAGYTAGVTSCDSNSTKPHYSQNGWSGGLQCGTCKCNNTCSTEYFNLTEKPEHASFVTCTSGCGSEAKTLYHLNYCESGYVEQNGTCTKDCVGYDLDSCPANGICSQCNGKYKLNDCSDGYYKGKTTETHLSCTNVNLTGCVSIPVGTIECRPCSGTLIGKSETCPTGYSSTYLRMTIYEDVDKQCCNQCPAGFTLDTCPENGNCDECGGKYKFKECAEGYYKDTLVKVDFATGSSTPAYDTITCTYCNGTLVGESEKCPSSSGTSFVGLKTGDGRKCCSGQTSPCAGYTLTSCPAHATCDTCEGKYKISSCETGYIVAGSICVANSGSGSGGGGGTRPASGPCDDLTGMDRCCCLWRAGAIDSTGSPTGAYNFQLASGGDMMIDEPGCQNIDRAGCPNMPSNR